MALPLVGILFSLLSGVSVSLSPNIVIVYIYASVCKIPLCHLLYSLSLGNQLLVQALHRLCSLWRRQLDGEEANKLFKSTQTTLLFLNLVCDLVDFLQSF